MAYWHVDDTDTLVRRIRDDKLPIPGATDTELAAVRVFLEVVTEPTLDDWESRGPVSLTFNTGVTPPIVERTWPNTETTPLPDYKKRLRRQVLADALQTIEESHEQTVLILAALGVIPQGRIDTIKSDIQAPVDAAITKYQAIKDAVTHADAKTAFDT